MRKVLMVIDCLGSGGAQRQLVNLAIGLKGLGYHVKFFVYYQQDFFEKKLDENNIPVVYVLKKDKIGYNVVRGLSELIKKEKFEFVISFLTTPNTYAALALKISGSKNTVLITSERTRTNLDRFSLRVLLQRLAHKQANAVVFNSYHERENWVSHYPFLKTKSYTIYNGIDNKKFSLRPLPSTFKYKLLVVGSISSAKNGLCIIDALSIYNKTAKNKVSITWIGEKIRHIKDKREYLQKMEEKIKALSLEKYWTWLDPQKDILSYYHEYDALIHASLIEGLPNVVCEALSCGLPVIASAVHDHPILVENYKRGLLFDPAEPKELAEKIGYYYHLTEDQICEMSLNGHMYSNQSLSFEHYIESFDKLLNNIQ